ncbi:MAG: hypothetical protein Q7T18_06110 [Sedimentisphaerales bacterium]|nr:hypothetical protein [Sedimentisphaerales bacterium]
MARNHSGQMALYEAVNKERFKAAQKKELSRLVPDEAGKTEPAPRTQPVTIPPQQAKTAEVKQAVWTKKPKMFEFVHGRVEAFIPYPIAVTIVMAFLLLLVGSFRTGQWLSKHQVGETAFSQKTEQSSETVVNLADTAKVAKEMARSAVAKRSITPAQTTTTGSEYVIVLAELKNAASARDMEPAKQYFDENGIATEIKNVRGSYFLVTTEKYDGFSKGTSGYDVVEKVKQIGAKYKAPAGYGGFGSKPFSDAYGRKM